MTALPRNPVEVSAAALQSQNSAAGRSAPNRAQSIGGGESESDSIPKFAVLVGNAGETVSSPARTEVPRQALPPELDQLGRGIDLPVEQTIDQLGGEAGLTVPPTTMANPDDITTAQQGKNLEPDRVPHGEGLRHAGITALSGVSVSALSLTGQITNEGSVASGANAQVVVPGGRPAEVAALTQQADNSPKAQEHLVSRLAESAVQENAAAKSDLGSSNSASRVEQTIAARSDLAIMRADRASVSNDKVPPRPVPLNSQSPQVEPARLDAPRDVPQPRPTSGQVDPAILPVQTTESVSVPTNAASSAASLSLNSSNDEPRLQDVKVLGSRIIEVPPGANDRTAQGTTVKVIDLQLQPETLGRIGAQLKQTAGGLEVRLEPSLADTAVLLKEDKLALQRILGVIGSISDPAVVRIVDPIADQRQADGQEALVDLDLSEAGQSGGHAATSGDLYGEGYSNDSSENSQRVAEQDSLDSGRQRASDDIYI